MRAPARRRQAAPARVKSYPAPSGGLIANQNLALPDPRGPGGVRLNGAARLENWFPTATGARMRAGSQKYATIGAGAAVTRLFAYANGNNKKLFAANASAIYDITTVADANVSPAAAVSGLAGGDWSVVQFATSAGTYLRLANGLNTPYVFDGTTWGTTPAITGIANPANLRFVWAFKQRLFFLEKDTLDAWYLPVDSIGGAAVKLPLGGVFSRGGSLLFGASWSIEAGFGPTEQCVFVTTEGEVAVYSGSDPGGGLGTWSLVGVYRIGKPLGDHAFVKAGGDLLIATDIGAVPLSVAVQRDIAALAPSAASYAIETEWNKAVAARSGTPWHCAMWPTKQTVAVALPTGTTGDPRWLVANARTGAWTAYTGWDATCLKTFNDRLFFGTASGTVIEAEVTGADQGVPYTATAVPMFDTLRAPAALKTPGLARAVYQAPAAVNERLSVQRDYEIALPPPPDVAAAGAANVWGSAIWGTSTWGAARDKRTFEVWRSVSGQGAALAPAVQISSGGVTPPDVELVRIDMTYDIAEAVT